ncbi:hypothetical protein J4Q44_G00279360 [Coregonus suidteri]|uniref:Cysteine-rich PDZ-binding protein n=1 Tax=Coregonus suidteri TaxID=861788 RepID=A0AAN8L1P1_9TELE
MFCDNCEKKLGRRATTVALGRLSKKARFDPYGKPGNSGKSGFGICRICKSSVHHSGSHYCQGCAYKGSVPCVGRRFWTPRTTSRPPSDRPPV